MAERRPLHLPGLTIRCGITVLAECRRHHLPVLAARSRTTAPLVTAGRVPLTLAIRSRAIARG